MVRWFLGLSVASTASATPVQLAQQGRLVGPNGTPIEGGHTLVARICPNATPVVGETCHVETFSDVSFDDGYFSVLLGTNTALDHTFFDAGTMYVGFSVDGTDLAPRQRLASFAMRSGGMVLLGTAPDNACSGGQNVGAIAYRRNNVEFCSTTGWKPLAVGDLVVDAGGYRQWSSGEHAISCETYIRPPAGTGRLYLGNTGDGIYRIDPDGPSGSNPPFDVWCDMTFQNGGWTLLLNLDTSDGNVMWWGNPLWTNTSTHGTLDTTPFSDDLKSPAFFRLNSASQILIQVHEEGTVRGWKLWNKPNLNPLSTYLAGGDNTPLGTSVAGSSVGSLASNERLVRTTTTLYANHCWQQGGASCVTANGSSPDGNRIGSNENANADNRDGGLGNWGDMSYCCVGGPYAGRACNGGGSTFRTCSEAQGGWSADYISGGEGTFGSDSCQPMTNTRTDSTCTGANWAKPNGLAYDYALWMR